MQNREFNLDARIVFDEEKMARVRKLDKPRGSTQSKVETRGW